MIRLKHILTELFDSKPFAFRKWSDKLITPTRRAVYYKFSSSKSDIDYIVLIDALLERDGNKGYNVAYVSFRNEGGDWTDLTNAGESYQVLATVIASAFDYHKSYGDVIDYYIFSGTSKPSERQSGYVDPKMITSRDRIYVALLKKKLPSGWRVIRRAKDYKVVPPKKKGT